MTNADDADTGSGASGQRLEGAVALAITEAGPAVGVGAWADAVMAPIPAIPAMARLRRCDFILVLHPSSFESGPRQVFMGPTVPSATAAGE